MTDYIAPLRDIRFVMDELLDFSTHYRLLGESAAADPEIVNSVIEAYARFCEQVLAPLNPIGDEQGCRWQNGKVTTPAGFREAYQQHVRDGWSALAGDPAYGGQGLPPSLRTVLGEMAGAANMAWHIYVIACHGAIDTLATHGSIEQREQYLGRLVEGSWTATMCLTESQCGSDLGLIRTRATPVENGAVLVTGTKIFISCGEHDLAENVIHIVLARLPDAEAGSAGLSLFVVPKFVVGPDSGPGERNSVHCGGIEKKMGIHGNATCVMHFEDALGYLVGEPNRGLAAMFTFMNSARLATGMQGLSHAELGYQKSLAYTRERLQGSSPASQRQRSSAADPIIAHPDVRRMLMIQKSYVEGCRAFNYFLAQQIDIAHLARDEADRKAARDALDLLTPISKAFCSEIGFESANLALQCFGGHGYIREWGVEQNVRDARIAALYEGTTGIQALDLLQRKVLGSGGVLLKSFTDRIERFCRGLAGDELQCCFARPLQELVWEWHTLTREIEEKSVRDPHTVGAVSVNYLMYSGYVCLAYFWAMAAASARQHEPGADSAETFYRAKLTTAHFYFAHILPRTRTCRDVIRAGTGPLMAIAADEL